MCPTPDADPVHATILPVFPGYSFMRMANMAPIAAASAVPPSILKNKISNFNNLGYFLLMLLQMFIAQWLAR